MDGHASQRVAQPAEEESLSTRSSAWPRAAQAAGRRIEPMPRSAVDVSKCYIVTFLPSARESVMARHWGVDAAAVAVLAASAPALAQTDPQPQPAPQAAPLPGITVTATRLDEARGSIQPSLGATRYEFSPGVIATIPTGENAPLNQVLLRAPGVVAGQLRPDPHPRRPQQRPVPARRHSIAGRPVAFHQRPDDPLRAQPVADHRCPAGAVRLPPGRRRRHHAQVGHHAIPAPRPT